MADRVQLLQVLLNLTINAFEAMSAMRANARALSSAPAVTRTARFVSACAILVLAFPGD